MYNIMKHVTHAIDRMDMQDWGLVLFAMIFIGFMCMRGFGSRKDY